MTRAWIVPALLLVAAAGCGSDYDPPAGTVTGSDAAPVGQVLDLEVDLPHLSFPGRPAGVGAVLDVSLALPSGASGTHEARVTYRGARVGGESVDVEDVSDRTAEVTIGGRAWSTGRIGPVQIEGTGFEYALRGETADAGWKVAGASWESQTGLEGTFAGMRRHRFLVAGTDYLAAGRLYVVSLASEAELLAGGTRARASSDPVLRRTGDGLYVINRLSYDNVQRLDPAEEFETAWQARVGAGSNPQDVFQARAGVGYVPRFEPPFHDLAVIDLDGGEVVGSIPLEEYAENADGYPRPFRVAGAGGAVFVALQDINRSFTAYEEGKLVVVDPATDEVTGVIPLPGKNPVTVQAVTEGGREKLMVALAGVMPGLLPQELSGGVAVVDVANRVFERWALDDDDVGGNVSDLVVARADLAYVLVSDDRYVSRVFAFDPRDGTVLRTVREDTDWIPGIALDSRGVLAVPDRAFANPGVCLYRVPGSPGASETLLGCAGLELPPVDVEPLD